MVEVLAGRPAQCHQASTTRMGASDSWIKVKLNYLVININICNDLRWDAHVDALCSKVASRLYFLKLFKRSGLSSDDLLCFYKSVIRSVLEYGSVVWHYHPTHAQSDKLEALQKRADRIILYPLKLASLKHRGG